LRIPAVAMIGTRTPASRSSAITRSPIGLIARPDRLPKRLRSSGSPLRGSSRSALTALMAVSAAAPLRSATLAAAR
jgi:hypothetical protein